MEHSVPMSYEQALAMGRTGRMLGSPVLNGYKSKGLHARHSDSDDEDWYIIYNFRFKILSSRNFLFSGASKGLRLKRQKIKYGFNSENSSKKYEQQKVIKSVSKIKIIKVTK